MIYCDVSGTTLSPTSSSHVLDLSWAQSCIGLPRFPIHVVMCVTPFCLGAYACKAAFYENDRRKMRIVEGIVGLSEDLGQFVRSLKLYLSGGGYSLLVSTVSFCS